MRCPLILTLVLCSCLKELPQESKADDTEPQVTDDSEVPGDDSEIQGEECTFYVDGDDDGYGDPNSPVVALCDSPPESLVTDNTDCDDFNVGVNPEGVEVCDALDNNCDGSIDGPDAVDSVPFYADTDADGYGDAAVMTEACSVPEGYVDNTQDCDDLNAAIHPGADELCDGVDNNCDLSADGDDATNRGSWYADTDSDQYGDISTLILSCYSPGTGYVNNALDCDDTNAGVNPSITGWASAPYGNDQWDYNCDTVEEQQYPIPGDCTIDGSGTCNLTIGFLAGQIPACGDSDEIITSCDADCVPQTSPTRRQKCR